ncbi:MAG TPA: hypothetical protein PKE27_22480 [Povalibacter sp.]|uniref:hypothetical protein n=1 Tax=Povalibacter sp. TaxID=1962978 RepID=UPI002C988599|nr:hypothetical protein [Povalibacter sp.]HMN47359.1 hypothetical protein [Povalibacter sp.]
MKRRHAGFAAWLVLSPVLAAGADATSFQLPAAESATVEKLACRSRHDVGVETIDARAYRGDHVSAEVRCSSHGVFMGSPMHYIVQCARSLGQWDCHGEWNEILVKVDEGEIPVRVEGQIPLGVSYQTIHGIASSGNFQGYPLREALAPPCYLNRGSAQEFVDVKCDGWHIVVSMWCPQSDCPRVFSMTKLGT